MVVKGGASTVGVATADGRATKLPRRCVMHAGDLRFLHRRDPQPRHPPVPTAAPLPRRSPVHTPPRPPPRRLAGRIV
jgi:hypothetical protein